MHSDTAGLLSDFFFQRNKEASSDTVLFVLYF